MEFIRECENWVLYGKKNENKRGYSNLVLINPAAIATPIDFTGMCGRVYFDDLYMDRVTPDIAIGDYYDIVIMNSDYRKTYTEMWIVSASNSRIKDYKKLKLDNHDFYQIRYINQKIKRALVINNEIVYPPVKRS